MPERLILVTNDDGIHAPGLQALIRVAQTFGRVLVIAPHEGQSGMSHAITVKYPIRIEKLSEEKNLTVYSCTGTPVDGVKLAINRLADRSLTMVLSGSNHGANSSSSIVYSGTMGAVLEGCINGIPSIGFSLLDISKEADFSTAIVYAKQIVSRVMEEGLPSGTCLNVNIPRNNGESIKGIKICRQNKGLWREEFDRRIDPQNQEYYWLTGEFHNLEPDANDTDEWALAHRYVSVVPVKIDLTDYQFINKIKHWENHTP